jgi:hypothetical protein
MRFFAAWLLLPPPCCSLPCQVVLRNVSVNYVDPSDIDTPEQYNAKVRRS